MAGSHEEERPSRELTTESNSRKKEQSGASNSTQLSHVANEEQGLLGQEIPHDKRVSLITTWLNNEREKFREGYISGRNDFDTPEWGIHRLTSRLQTEWKIASGERAYSLWNVLNAWDIINYERYTPSEQQQARTRFSPSRSRATISLNNKEHKLLDVMAETVKLPNYTLGQRDFHVPLDFYNRIGHQAPKG